MQDALMSILGNALKKTSRTMEDLSSGPGIAPDYAFPVVAPVVLALAAGVFGTYLASETGIALVRELKRRQRLREKRPDSPSLRGSPTTEEIEADGEINPRTLAVRLRLGSRLADLEPTLDTSLRHKELRNGQKRIKSRAPGLKGWLNDRRITVNYSTLVRYKKLAQRLRQVLSLDARLPLEWLLPGAVPEVEIPPDLREAYASAKRRFSRMLREHPNFSRLSRHVEDKLGVRQLLAVRRARRREKEERWVRRRLAKNARANAAAVAKRGKYSVKLAPDRVEATKQELIRFLQARDLPRPLVHLRNKVIHWMRTEACRG
jgi:hypothetical protein